MPPLFHASNNGKQSITLDLRHADGAAIFLKLCAGADVVIDNFRPGLLDSLSLGPEELRLANAALVTCSVTAYGDDGPRRDQPGHDVNFFGMSGAAMPLDGDEPIFPATPVVDNGVALFAPFCIVAALLRARTTGIGEHIDIAMVDVAIAMNSSSFLFARRPDPGSDGLPWPEYVKNETAGYGSYQAADGQWLTVGAMEPYFWTRFLDVLGRADLAGEQFSVGPRAAEVRGAIAEIIASRTRDHWLAAFEAVGTCVAPVHSAVDAAADPQVASRGMVFDVGDWPRVGFPARLASRRASRGSTKAAPTLGADNAAVYGAVGIGDAARRDLAKRGVI
jgi:crotonobetainyl-CoA:carnitine CoA-transferase CaiB-like acyl-CoA transferase